MKKIFFVIFAFLIFVNVNYSFNPEHLRIFSEQDDLKSWNQWRKKNPGIRPDLSHAVVNRGTFNGDISYVNFKYAKIIDFIPGRSSFRGADFSYCAIDQFKSITNGPPKIHFINTKFFRTKIIDSHFINAEFFSTDFNEAEIRNTKFEASTFKNVSFVKAKMENLYFSVEMYFVDFSFSTLIKTQIVGKKFYNVKFRNAMITDSVIYVENSNNLDFSYSNLIRTELVPSKFINYTFINANLTGSSFGNRYSVEVILTNVNFTNANLTNVNFHKSKFQNVIFKNADMTGAKLERKWYDYVKKQGVRNFDKIQWR